MTLLKTMEHSLKCSGQLVCIRVVTLVLLLFAMVRKFTIWDSHGGQVHGRRWLHKSQSEQYMVIQSPFVAKYLLQLNQGIEKMRLDEI